jgi:hypothetical protein
MLGESSRKEEAGHPRIARRTRKINVRRWRYTVIQRRMSLQLGKCTKMMGIFLFGGAGDVLVHRILSNLEIL